MGICLCCKRPKIWPQKLKADTKVDIGRRQSPINFVTNECQIREFADETNPLRIAHSITLIGLTITNTGFGWRVDIPDNVAISTLLTGGPLEHSYRLTQFHCHWGKTCDVGSEHTVDGRSYAAELHFVHWNTELYASAADAMSATDGLSVLAVFLEISAHENQELNKLLAHIEDIPFKGDVTKVAHNIDIKNLIPANQTYFTYYGSLTTPPFWESVVWIVFANPILCTELQIIKCRHLFSCNRFENSLTSGEWHLMENFRFTQPINDRVVTLVRQ